MSNAKIFAFKFVSVSASLLVAQALAGWAAPGQRGGGGGSSNSNANCNATKSCGGSGGASGSVFGSAPAGLSGFLPGSESQAAVRAAAAIQAITNAQNSQSGNVYRELIQQSRGSFPFDLGLNGEDPSGAFLGRSPFSFGSPLIDFGAPESTINLGGGASIGGEANTAAGTGRGAGGPGDGTGPGNGAGQGLGPGGNGTGGGGSNQPSPKPGPGPTPGPAAKPSVVDGPAAGPGPNSDVRANRGTAAPGNAQQAVSPSAPSVVRNGQLELGPARNPDGGFGYQVPVPLLLQARPDVDLASTTTAAQPGGGSLPNWLSYQPTTRTFTATKPPNGALPYLVELTVTTATGQQARIPVRIGEP